MMELQRITEKEKMLLYHLLQKYLYEMTRFYEDDLDEEGNYPYPYFEDYFFDPDRRAYLIRKEGAIAGFALLNRHSELGREVDWAMAEFCILPRYRREHLGLEAARRLFAGHPGRWEVKYATANSAGKRLWSRAAESYEPEKVTLPNGEEVLVFQTGPKGGSL